MPAMRRRRRTLLAGAGGLLAAPALAQGSVDFAGKTIEWVIPFSEGGGSDARVQVNFGAAGMKWLALSVAKLEAA